MQRSKDHESGNVEIVQHKQGKAAVAAYFVDEGSCSGNRNALSRNDHKIMTVSEYHRLEQRVKSSLSQNSTPLRFPDGPMTSTFASENSAGAIRGSFIACR